MSIRAEVIRLWLRCFIKRKMKRQTSLDQVRQSFDGYLNWIPFPPEQTQTTPVRTGGVPADQITRPASRTDCWILYLHGGGYVAGSSPLYRDFTWRIADVTAAGILCINYRLAPENPFPAAVEDAAMAYRGMLAEGKDPRRIALMGDSAGGGLVFAALLALRDQGVMLPGAAVALSPFTDLALTGPSLRENAKADPFLPVEGMQRLVDFYLAGAEPRTPYASPLYGDPSGLPPALIQVGSDEVLRDDAVRMAERLRAAGCTVEIELWPRMPHCWHLFWRVLPEAERAIDRIGEFVRSKLSA